MKIAMVINTSWNIVNFREGLVRAMIENGHEVIAIAPVDKYSNKVRSLVSKYVAVPSKNQGINPFEDLFLMYRYWRIFRQEKIECVLTYTIKPNIYASLAARLLSISTINNISGLGTAFINYSWLTFLVKQLYRVALRNSFSIFFQNEDDLYEFEREGLISKNISEVLPGSGINLDKFKVVEPRRDQTKGNVRFLLVARLLLDKGVREFVEAAIRIKKNYPDTRFLLLGPIDDDNPRGIDKLKLSSWIENGYVSYLGESADVRRHIENSDCVVLPSYREGLPRVLLEAGAMGRPSIATNVEGCRDAIEDGVTGLLCPMRDSRGLASRMEYFLKMPLEERNGMGIEARKRIVNLFDEKFVIDAYLRVLNEIEH